LDDFLEDKAQSASDIHALRFIELEQCYRGPPDVGFANYLEIALAKMVGPLLLTWIEERNDRSCNWIDSCKIRTFVRVAPSAR